MGLESARFRDDPVLERIAAGDTSAFLRFGTTGPAVEKVQQALIDAGFDIPSGATGNFFQQTSDAVVAYKTDRGLMPNDPVAGRGTVTKLDGEWALPFADHEEFVSWNRALPEFNFTRRAENARRLSGAAFNLAPTSSWLPAPIKDTMFASFMSLLDPGGSPLGRFTPSATWGLSPLDLYHVHLVVEKPLFDRQVWDPAIVGREAVHARLGQLRTRATVAGPSGSPAWTAAYAGLLVSSGVTGMVANTLETVLQISATTGVPVKMVWHTFEHHRPAAMSVTDPRRGWWNDLAPAPSGVTQTPFGAGHGAMTQAVDDLIGLSFIVDAFGTVTVMSEIDTDAAALVGLDERRLTAARANP